MKVAFTDKEIAKLSKHNFTFSSDKCKAYLLINHNQSKMITKRTETQWFGLKKDKIVYKAENSLIEFETYHYQINKTKIKGFDTLTPAINFIAKTQN